MTCREIADVLMDYLDGGMSPEQHRRFEEHLAECPDCMAYLESYRHTVRLGKAAWGEGLEPTVGEIPEELVRAIMEARGRQAGMSRRQ